MSNSMIDSRLEAIRDIIQADVGNRGLARESVDNLLTACPDDFANACRSIAEHPSPRVGIVTGFMIPSVDPPTGETDGPLGAIFLAQAFSKLRILTVLFSDDSAYNAIRSAVSILPDLTGTEYARLPSAEAVASQVPPLLRDIKPKAYREATFRSLDPLTHLIAIERIGVNHRPRTLRRQPASTLETIGDFIDRIPRLKRDRCYTMRGRDITDLTAPAHLLFTESPPYATIGIGDGGNEIGMGKIAWDTIRRNIPNGELIACSVPTDHLIVAGVSNWGAYGLAAGVMLLRGLVDTTLFDPERERSLLENMVAFGPLVDGVTGQRTATVDGLSFAEYAKPIKQIRQVLPRANET
jgi:hypothetical protein